MSMGLASDRNTPRLLGAAFLFVFVASVLSEALLALAVGSGGISDILVSVADNLDLMRISSLVALLNSLGIIVLAALLYLVLHKQHEIIALVALGWYVAEAITLAASKIGAYALMPLSVEFVERGEPASSYYQTLGDFFYYGFDRQGYEIHSLFFVMGAILWYYLFYRSSYIPRALAIWGIAAVSLVAINVVLTLYDRDVGRLLILVVAYLPYEVAIGLWLLVRGDGRIRKERDQAG